MSDEEWWKAGEPLFDRYFDTDRFPTVTRVAAAGAFERPTGEGQYTVAWARESFEFGLGRLLDGIEAFVATRAAEPAGPDAG